MKERRHKSETPPPQAEHLSLSGALRLPYTCLCPLPGLPVNGAVLLETLHLMIVDSVCAILLPKVVQV